VEIIRYLGIIIDDRLRFKKHYEYMQKKTSFLNRTGNFLSAYTTCVICKSIIAFLLNIVRL